MPPQVPGSQKFKVQNGMKKHKITICKQIFPLLTLKKLFFLFRWLFCPEKSQKNFYCIWPSLKYQSVNLWPIMQRHTWDVSALCRTKFKSQIWFSPHCFLYNPKKKLYRKRYLKIGQTWIKLSENWFLLQIPIRRDDDCCQISRREFISKLNLHIMKIGTK